MIRYGLAWCAAILLALLASWWIGGTAGAGIGVGAASGVLLCFLGSAFLRHVLATRPERALHAVVAAFLAKLALLAVGGISFRYVPALAERVDWMAFLIAFATAVALLTPIGAWSAVSAGRAGPAGVRRGEAGRA